MQIAISSAEASGDRVGGQLALEIRRLAPDATLWGMGGRHLREAGVELVSDATRFGAIGIASALPQIPRILAERRRVLKEMAARKPDVLVAIDAGAFHLGFGPFEGLCPWTRKHLPDTKILYSFPPGSWRRTLRGTTLGEAADVVATPFPWSESELRRFGVNAHFVGHPLLDLVRPQLDRETFAQRYGLDPDLPVVGLLPGSRAQEIRHILPVLFDAAARIHRRVPGVQFVLALAPTVSRQTIEAARMASRNRWAQERASSGPGPSRRPPAGGLAPPIAVPVDGLPDDLARRQRGWIERSGGAPGDGDFPLAVVEGLTYDVMAASDILLCASGTATLEAAILGKPMVIVYRMGPEHQLEYLFIRRRLPPHVGMPNLLADRRICPELLQEDANPEAIAGEAIAMLLEPERLLRMRADLHEAVASLGEPGGAARTAQMVVDLARNR